MRRILYCPNESMLEEASAISKVNSLQIQVGDSESTSDLEFDRELVSVVEIPEFNYLEYKKNIEKGLHQVFVYKNDFIAIDNTITVTFDSEEIAPFITEKHYAKFVFPCNKSGEFTADVVYNKKVLESIVFNVD